MMPAATDVLMILLVEYWLLTEELDRVEDVLDMSEAVVRDGMVRAQRAHSVHCVGRNQRV